MKLWLDRLCGAVPTQLPIAIKDSLKQPLCDAERQVELSVLPTSIGSEVNVKINTIVLGAWALLLARYSCTLDVLFGTNIYASLGRS
ncbi:hypothetical protein, partial [Chamaesiphon sp. GL140_3_metabinner_50]|uniref:hypothetical protein n=1 Tax=Chamaesiphon sp. GL140_3_metabinner_50 TaxID=2970812 RepID=UPI0025DF83EF